MKNVGFDNAFAHSTYRRLRSGSLPAETPPESRAEIEAWALEYERHHGITTFESSADFLAWLDDAAAARTVADRLKSADATLGTTLDDAARELGFDPDEIFQLKREREDDQ